MSLPGLDDANRKWWILAAMGGTIGVVLLDETIVGVALPTIRHELGLSMVGAHWVVNAYLLVLAGLVAAGGKLGDVLGLRRVMVLGLGVFGMASAAAGFASSGTELIVARAVQGVGSAIVFPASMAMVGVAFAEEQRGMALGIYGAIGTVFLSLGPLLGGLFTDLLSWRWIFWVNPFLVLVIISIVTGAWIDPPRPEVRPRFDRRGLSSLVTGLGLIVFAIMQGPETGWDHPALWSMLAVGAVSLALFVAAERRVPAPLIEVDLFRNPSFTVCTLTVFMAQFSKIAVIIFGALYFQATLGMAPLAAGVALLAAVGPEPFFGVLAGRWADRHGARAPAMTGILLTAAALLWMAAAAPWKDYWTMAPALFVWGAAQPLLFVPSMRAVMNAVPVEKQGQAGGILLTLQLLGGTVGMTVCGTLIAVTGDSWLVFLVSGSVAFVVLLMSLRWLDPSRDVATEEAAAPAP